MIKFHKINIIKFNLIFFYNNLFLYLKLKKNIYKHRYKLISHFL